MATMKERMAEMEAKNDRILALLENRATVPASTTVVETPKSLSVMLDSSLKAFKAKTEPHTLKDGGIFQKALTHGFTILQGKKGSVLSYVVPGGFKDKHFPLNDEAAIHMTLNTARDMVKALEYLVSLKKA